MDEISENFPFMNLTKDIKLLIVKLSRNAYGMMCSCKEMYKLVSENHFFWETYFHHIYGQNSLDWPSSKDLSWKEKTKKKMIIFEKNKQKFYNKFYFNFLFFPVRKV
eukprot:TRINITY_DN7867_c0_g1_i1.p1 TRINITY_DN7867_c0_g1~~TRINITY_DN7867_c0_g1_i1.p1  ORF type:complete len:107 (+),score=17.17 TRINITY_DN7867_c0_g1_i1:14-334(+)